MNRKEVVENETIVEIPPMAAVGYLGDPEASVPLRPSLLNISVMSTKETSRRTGINLRRLLPNTVRRGRMKMIICVIAHTHMCLLPLHQNKVHLMVVQVFGATGTANWNSNVPVNQMFRQDELADVIGVTKGKGHKGVASPWRTKKLPCKTHQRLYKVACTGSWQSVPVGFSRARTEQEGYHHQTEINKIYNISQGYLIKDHN
ncbi:60S ribosomal protein L3 [Galemys pyrenaicus]|uniref:60S ribosomal protein L3 n=1 Tax=Galemys pyrenaicus TaxID=202257 RepID=A0A8J6DXU9_GALPY|nr:60S ribosomal protein L3 [Galemys pyrenaicus]